MPVHARVPVTQYFPPTMPRIFFLTRDVHCRKRVWICRDKLLECYEVVLNSLLIFFRMALFIRFASLWLRESDSPVSGIAVHVGFFEFGNIQNVVRTDGLRKSGTRKLNHLVFNHPGFQRR